MDIKAVNSAVEEAVSKYDVIIDQNGMGGAVGDFDNDGDMDWFVTSIYRHPIRQPTVSQSGRWCVRRCHGRTRR